MEKFNKGRVFVNVDEALAYAAEQKNPSRAVNLLVRASIDRGELSFAADLSYRADMMPA